MTSETPINRLHRRNLLVAGGVGGLAAATGLLAPPTAVADGHNLHSPRPRWRKPIVIAHRGASGKRPEHTLAAYRLAIDMGADVIEPDLVSTKDGVLVARHENEISSTTDVAEHPEFADRHTTKRIDGTWQTGWFTEDFTYAELSTLRAKERLPELRPASTRFDGRLRIPTIAEVIDLARFESKRRNRRIGVYPETKHPTYFRNQGLPLEPGILRELRRVGWTRRSSPVFIQSFEISNLRALSRRTEVKLIQLVGGSGAPFDQVVAGTGVTYDDMVTAGGLRRIGRYARGIGPDKYRLIPLRPDGTLGRATDVVDDAHAAGLLVHPYTFRDENFFLPNEYDEGANPLEHGDAVGELLRFFELGVDGVFGDFPDTTFEARWQFLAARRAEWAATG